MRNDPPTIPLPGDPSVPVNIRRSARARRIALKVSRLDGSVTLTLPSGVSLVSAMMFLHDRKDWLDAALSDSARPTLVGPGTQLPIEGIPHRIETARIRSPKVTDGALLVPEARPAAAAMAFLKLRARDRLAERVALHARAIGRTAGSLTLRDTRSRWGSCTARGDLMFNWRLIMAPPAILDYVAAHEVAHLAHMDHSPRFWAKVAQIYPDHAAARRWLKHEGSALHGFRFSPA